MSKRFMATGTGPFFVLSVSFLLSSGDFNSPEENRWSSGVKISGVVDTFSWNKGVIYCGWQHTSGFRKLPRLQTWGTLDDSDPLILWRCSLDHWPRPQYHPPAVGSRLPQAIQVTWDLTGTQVITWFHSNSKLTGGSHRWISQVDLAQIWGEAVK